MSKKLKRGDRIKVNNLSILRDIIGERGTVWAVDVYSDTDIVSYTLDTYGSQHLYRSDVRYLDKLGVSQ